MNDPGARPEPAPDDAGEAASSRSTLKFVLLLSLCTICCAGFIALGIWQVERLGWKLALIDRVNARVHATPMPAPGPDAWPTITAKRDSYRHVTALGHYLNDRETLVDANTDYGPGFWVLTPFTTKRGFTILINRGFVPPEHRAAKSRTDSEITGETRVTGLLRMTEPAGTLLRHNDPSTGRWYSRDVAAIAKARGLGPIAPYFIDAERRQLPQDAPVGGLTIIHFRNAHLQYAITWFGLAVMMVVGGALLIRDQRRR